jgi:hypothetical protein
MAVTPALQVELPRTSVTASNHGPSGGGGYRKANLDTTVREDTKNLDLKAARIRTEVMAATWEVHQLREILPTILRVTSYSENTVIQKRSSHI